MITIIIVSFLLFLATYPSGKAVLALAGKNESTPLTDYVFTGVALVNTILSYYSIYFPTGCGPAIILLSISVIIILIMKWNQSLFKFKVDINTAIILVVFAVLIAMIAADGPRNGDSISYHIPAIRWIQEYAVVPGLGNLHGRYAFNPNIFNLMAGFTFSGITGFPVYAVNPFLCFIFFVYLFSLYRNRQKFPAGIQLFFMIIGILSIQFMMLRLSSPTPDLAAGLLPLYIFLRFIEEENLNHPEQSPFGFILMLSILSAYLVTVKLTTVFIILIPVIVIFRFRNRIALRHLVILFFTGALTVTPWLVRNYFLSGYLVYPSTQLDVFHPDWKIPGWAVDFDQKIIYNWAKWPDSGAEKVENMTIGQWLPFWFSKLQAFWKGFLCLALVSPAIVISLYIKRKGSRYRELLEMWLVSFGAVLFWFFTAPDPRFGFPFIVVFTLSFLLFLRPEAETVPRMKNLTKAAGILFLVISLVFPSKLVFGLRHQLLSTILKPLPVETYITPKMRQEVSYYTLENIRIDPSTFPVCNTYTEAIEQTGRSGEVKLLFRSNKIQDGFRMDEQTDK